MRRIVLALAFVGALLALGAGTALSQANTTTEETKLPLDIFIEDPCTGELVHLTGELHIIFHITEDVNGGLHTQTQYQPQGVSGVGLTSGREYRGVGETRGEFNWRDLTGLPSERTFVSNFKIISTDPTDNFLLHETVHETVNPNGEVTVTVGDFSAECRG